MALVPQRRPALCYGSRSRTYNLTVSTSASSPIPSPAIPSFLHPPPMSGGARAQEQPPLKKLEWDWDLEHQDRAKETKADRAVHNAQPFLVDRRVLKDVVKEKLRVDVARIVFLSSGAS